MSHTGRSLGRLLGSALRLAAGALGTAPGRTDAANRRRRPAPARPDRSRDGVPAPPDRSPQAPPAAYPGDFTGRVRAEYRPDLDGDGDPGEIVWTWVPFEEDHQRGKDRPVLLVGRDHGWLLGLMLSSRDHDERPSRSGEHWLDLGAGDWDVRRRPSEVRLDRVVRVDPAAMRREGAVLDRARFDTVVRSLEARAD